MAKDGWDEVNSDRGPKPPVEVVPDAELDSELNAHLRALRDALVTRYEREVESGTLDPSRWPEIQQADEWFSESRLKLPLGLELRLAEGVIVAHPRAAVAAGDAELAHEVEIGPCGHGSASVLVDGDVAWRDGIALQGRGHALLGKGAVFLARDHPGDHEAAEEVQHHVEQEVDAAAYGDKLGDIPGPHLVRGAAGLPAPGVCQATCRLGAYPGHLIQA